LPACRLRANAARDPRPADHDRGRRHAGLGVPVTLAADGELGVPTAGSSINGAAAYGVMASVMGRRRGRRRPGRGRAGRVRLGRGHCPGRARCAWRRSGGGIAIHGGGPRPEHAGRARRHGFSSGTGSITFNSLAKTTLQLAAKPEMRGRVMALWALGHGLARRPSAGRSSAGSAQEAGPRWALIVGGVAHARACGPVSALSWAVGHGRANLARKPGKTLCRISRGWMTRRDAKTTVELR